jgi:hypothetical protein
MGEDPRIALRRELGEPAAEALSSVSGVEAEHFANLLTEARETERRAMQDAAESSLSFVPRFARGAVKRIVFGG